MADLDSISATEAVRLVGSSSNGAEQTPIKSTNIGDMTVSDGLSGGGLFALLSVPTANTPVEVKVGASRLTDRKLITFQAVDADFYWGYANTVTAGVAGSGTLLKKGATARWAANPAGATPLQIWVVCATATKTGKVTEST